VSFVGNQRDLVDGHIEPLDPTASVLDGDGDDATTADSDLPGIGAREG